MKISEHKTAIPSFRTLEARGSELPKEVATKESKEKTMEAIAEAFGKELSELDKRQVAWIRLLLNTYPELKFEASIKIELTLDELIGAIKERKDYIYTKDVPNTSIGANVLTSVALIPYLVNNFKLVRKPKSGNN